MNPGLMREANDATNPRLERVHCMKNLWSITSTSAGGGAENLTITLGGAELGEATVRYDEATANVSAKLDLAPLPLPMEQLEQLHQEFAEELMAFVSNRGAHAQGTEGSVTYRLGAHAHTLELPSHQEIGLGYPNSW